MFEHPYFDFCETLYRDFLEQRLHLDSRLRSTFQLDYLPEPYLQFGDQTNPLIILTTNPGAGMPHQHRTEILTGKSLVKADASYQELAQQLADWYFLNLTGAALRRIGGMIDFSRAAGYSGMLQIEAIPFHSPALPKKRKLLEELPGDTLLTHYVTLLREFLAERPVFALSAASSKSALGWEAIQSSAWLSWITRQMGLNLQNAELTPILMKGDRATCAVVASPRQDTPKVLVLMMGGNHLPASKRLEKIAALLRAQHR